MSSFQTCWDTLYFEREDSQKQLSNKSYCIPQRSVLRHLSRFYEFPWDSQRAEKASGIAKAEKQNLKKKDYFYNSVFAGGQEDQIDTSAKGGFTSSSLTSSSSQKSNNDDSNTTVTFVKATLGREASIHCIAENLVGQKTVSLPKANEVRGSNLLRD